MGTRHLIAVIVDGVPRVAQYGQWSCPENQGRAIVDFVQRTDMAAFRAKVAACRPLTGDEIREVRNEAFLSIGVVPRDGYVSDSAADMVDEAHPHTSRRFGYKVLDYIHQGRPGTPVACDSWDFGNDSLLCEWAYVLDLDTMVLEVYRGFQREPHTAGRWASARPADVDGYYPVRLVGTFPMASIPENWTEVVRAEGGGE